MYSLDETHYSSLKRGEKENEKQNYIGIALRCVIKDRAKDKRVKTVRQRTVPCLSNNADEGMGFWDFVGR